MFKRKKVVEQAEPSRMPPPYRIMVRQTGDSTWTWAVQVRMLSMSRSGTPYYKSMSNAGDYGTSSTKEGAYAAAKTAYCEHEKMDRWSRETEYFTPTSEWCK